MKLESFAEFEQKMQQSVGKVIVGKSEVIRQLVIALIAGGHVLLEDLPGTGKTMMLRAFSRSIGGTFRRIQCTPDLIPADLTGINFYNPKEGRFEFRPGPLFANIVLADEINRATPRSQSALLEVMEEKQVSIDGETYPMKEPYLVMATENPIEFAGTFPLPEAQMDRFLMRMSLGYMQREEEIQVLRRRDSRHIEEELTPVTTPEEIRALSEAYREVSVSDDVAGYVMDLAEYTRNSRLLRCGLSTRGTLALYKTSQIRAALSGRDYVIPEDVKAEAAYVVPHRLTLARRADLDVNIFMNTMLEKVPVPLEEL
jgi:MoxR-like ATPase